MSLATVAASIRTVLPPTPDPGREAVGDGAAGSKFSSLLEAFGGGAAKSEAAAEGAGETAAPAAATGDTTPTTRAATNLDAALAKLSRDASNGAATGGGGKAHPAATPAPGAPAPAPAPTPAEMKEVLLAAATSGGRKGEGAAGAPDSASSTSASDRDSKPVASDATAGAGMSGLLYSALVAPALVAPPLATSASAAPTVSEGVLRALQESISASGATSSSAASSAASANPAQSGGAATNLRKLIGDDPTFVVAAAQTRTYLGLDSPSRVTLASAQVMAAAAGAAVSTGPSGPSSSGAPSSTKRAPAIASAPPPSTTGEGPPPAGAMTPIGVRPVAAPAKSTDSQGDSSSSSASTKTVASDTVVASFADTLVGAVSLAQLPDVVAEAADELSAAVDATSALGAAAAQPIKELQLDLQPAELGSVQLTMRMVNGKLSIVVGVAKASTLSAIEGERDAITARLGADGATLDSLVVTQLGAASAPATTADSPEGATSGSQDNASNRANGDAPSGGDNASSRNGASDAGRRQNSARSMPSRRGSGDLVV